MTATEWIEEFTGLKVPGGEPAGKDIAADAEALEAEAAQKQQLLADARQVVAGVKADFQKAMQLEVKTKGAYFKQKLLEVKGTQTDEADFTELDFQSLKLGPETETAIAKGKNTIINQNERLKAAQIERAGKKEPLFTQEEIQEEYWFPLVRERILPETFVADIYSKTQHMLDETNALYEKGVAEKKKKGQLTPKTNRLRDAMDTGSDLLAVGSDLGLAFGKGTVDAKRAAEVLNLLSEGVRTGGKVYDKAKEKEFADAASMALDNIGLLTEIILTQKGAPANTISAVKSGFKAGGAAIAAGKAFASGEDGVPKGLDSLMDVLKASLDAAASATDDPEKKKQLQIAATSAPLLLKSVALGMDIAKKVDDGDADGVVDCLTKAAKNALSTIQDIKKIEQTSGLSKDAAKKKGADIDKQTTDITQDINLANFGIKTLIAAKTMSKKGEHLKAINKIIQNVGKGLADTLEKAGVDKKQAAQIAGIYNAASSAPAILEMLCNDPPDVPGAMNALGAGIETSFKTAAPNNKELLQAGSGLKQGIAGLSTGIQIKALYDKGEYDKGIETFAKGVQAQVQGIFDIKDVKTAEQLAAEAAKAAATPAPTPAPESFTDKQGRLSTKTTAENRARQKEKDDKAKQKKELDLGAAPVTSTAPPDPNAPTPDKVKNLVGDIQKLAQKANKEIQAAMEVVAKVEAELQKVEDATAVEEILKEAVSELTDFSDAEAAGIEASKIDKLIAKIEKDRLLWNLAIQIAEGGAAFAANFVPALGVPGMVARLAANMVAAGQRLQQYSRWVANQKDFEAAQDALASSSANFVKNQGSQAIYYTMQSLFKAAEIIGNVMKLSGVAGPAAAGLEAVAKASSKAAEIIQKHKKKEELEAAWKITQKAFKNPGNRKLGLKARSLNPTLAKYSIAWGAVVKNDPLARNALAACQLTDAALADENANVDKVVNYLERFYEDDDRLYRELEDQADWLPKDIELTLRSWAKVKQLAIKHVKLKNPDTGNIDGLLAQLKDKVSSLDQAGITVRIQALEDLNKALDAYQPKTAKPKDAEGVKKVCALLQKQASQTLAEAKERAAVLAAEAKRLAKQPDALGELNAQIAKVEACQHTDDLADLQAVHTGAQSAMSHIKATESSKANIAVQSHLKQLEEKLAPLERLIEKLEQEEAELEEAA